MGQNFINFFSWVDIHGIYYIVRNGNQNWGSNFLKKIPFLTRMKQNRTKITTTNNEDD